jgi:pimeloyl-ACP methyl ester carboxylesterase
VEHTCQWCDPLQLIEFVGTRRLPHGRHVTIPRAGHTVQDDNPKDLLAELRRFLAPEN